MGAGAIPYGYCQCGCGGVAPIARRTRTGIGHVKGQPIRFIQGHATSLRTSEECYQWNGGRKMDDGYVMVHAPWHPRATSSPYIPEHILMVEAALGRFLVDDEIVHHRDEDRANNIPENLQVCHDNFEHLMEHRWMRARKECGHADWRLCRGCKQWGPPDEIVAADIRRPHISVGFHQVCRKEYNRAHHKSAHARSSQSSLLVE